MAARLLVVCLLARASGWCDHGERRGELRGCLGTRIPAWTPFPEIRACLEPCVAAALEALGAGAASKAPPLLPSLGGYADLLERVPTWRLAPSYKKGAPRYRVSANTPANVVIRCPMDDGNACLRPEDGDAGAVVDALEGNLTARGSRGALWHAHAFKMWPQEAAWDSGLASVLRMSPRLTFFTTNPALKRADVVPVPVGLRDHLAGAYGPFNGRPLAPKAEEVIRWDLAAVPPWRSRTKLLDCDGFRMSWSHTGAGGHSYGRAVALTALGRAGFSCDATPRNHSAYVAGLRAAKFVLCPRGNGVQSYRAWEALALGAVPVILRTHPAPGGTHDALYDGLPVVLIGPSTVRPVKHDAWGEITRPFLEGEAARIEGRAFDLAPSFLPYWLGRLFNNTFGP